MTVQTEREALLPCPFCGSPAEDDFARHYRNISTGAIEQAVAVYCRSCSADISICLADVDGLTRDEAMALCHDQWNARSQPSAPALPAEAIKAGMLALIEDNMLLRQSIIDSDYGDTTALEALFTERQADIESLRALLPTQGDKA